MKAFAFVSTFLIALMCAFLIGVIIGRKSTTLVPYTNCHEAKAVKESEGK